MALAMPRQIRAVTVKKAMYNRLVRLIFMRKTTLPRTKTDITPALNTFHMISMKIWS